MPPSRSIALVRASGFGALPRMLEERAGERALIDAFEKEDLPILLRDAPATPLPLAAMMGLFERSAHLLGDRGFGLEVGQQMTHRGYGLWLDFSTRAATLGDALNRAVATSWAHQSGARLELVVAGQHRVLRFVTPHLDLAHTQHADHLLPPMLTFVRLYLGRGWQPDWVELNYARDADARIIEDRLQVPIRYGQPGSGIALRMEDLCRPKSLIRDEAAPIVTLRDVKSDLLLKDAPEPARSLSAVVALRLLDGRCDIEGAARHAGMSVQGLQRRLRNKGFTYREILDAARRARAVGLLLETRLPILQIALSLGYEEHSTFTRAFTRWFGFSPSEFRQSRGPGFTPGAHRPA